MFIQRVNKEMLIKFFLSRDIRSLCNTTHNNVQYPPITGNRRQYYTRTKYIKFTRSPQNYPSFLYAVYLTRSFGRIIVQHGITKFGMFYLFLILAYRYS